jgi:curved DNA-binding protein CbpA
MKHLALFLKDIYFNRRSGRLVFKREDIEKYFFFQEGNLVQIKTNQPEERLGEVLFKLERITRDAHTRMDDFIEPNANIGEVLKNKGLISEQDLSEALIYQLRETTLNAFPYFDAEIAFQEKPDFVGMSEDVRISIPFLIEYGIRRMTFSPALKAFLTRKVPRQKSASFAYLLTDEEKNVLNKVKGDVTSDKLLQGLPVQPDFFWKSLYLFFCLDLIEFEAAPEVQSAKVEAKAAEPRSGEAMTQIAEVTTMREALTSKDYYQILGVPRTASESDIKKAYFGLARKYHPDRFDRNILSAFRDQIEEVFDAITNAYRTLINREKRRGYDAGVGVGKADDPQDQLKRADIKFRQGKTLYNQDRFNEAVSLLSEAVRLRKNKGDYYLLLAMAESKIPAYSKKAEEDFLNAIRLEAWNPEAYIGLGLLYKNEGLITKATKQFQKAVEADPDHHMARQELDKILKASRKKGLAGLFQGLFGSKKK